MFSTTKSLALCTVLAATTGFFLLFPVDGKAVSSYARQTGLSCNSCHIGFDPVPLFTRTGRLFVMRGFQQPDSIHGKLRFEGYDAEGNSEGNEEYGGNYLALNWQDFFAARLITGVASGSSNGDTTSTAGSRMALFITGPVTDWLGLYTEVGYLGNNSLNSVGTDPTSPDTTGNPTNLNYFAYDEYRLTASRMVGEDSFIAMAVGNEYPDAINEFVFPVYQIRPWGYGHGGLGNEYSTTAYSFYGFWKNRWFTQISFLTGDYDHSWSDGHNMYVNIAYNGIPGTGERFRRQGHDVWWVAEFLTGDNIGSQVNRMKTSYLCPAGCPAGVSDANFSISNGIGYQWNSTISDLAAYNGTGTETVEEGNAWRLSAHSAAGDNGNHSWYASFAFAGNQQDYLSGASSDKTTVGLSLRYFYNRTYGAGFYVNRSLTYDYVNPAQQTFEVQSPTFWGAQLYWAPAMNVNIRMSYGPVETVAIDPANQLDLGSRWDIILDYML